WDSNWGLGYGAGGYGYGRSWIRPPRKPPTRVRVGEVTVSGQLPPELVQRVVRQNFGRFRLCYEHGLSKTPELSGTVRTRFLIGRSGAVDGAGDGGSSMPDAAVTACVVRSFWGLSFPEPETGIVTVTYAVAFSPG